MENFTRRGGRSLLCRIFPPAFRFFASVTDYNFFKPHWFIAFFSLISLILPLFLPQAAFAAGYLEGYDTTPKPAEISWWSTIAYLVSLFIVFAFVVTAAYIASRYLGKHFAQVAASDGGRILAHLPLGPNRSVCVVELAGRGYVLGVTDHQINLIREIDDADELDTIRAAREKAAGDVLAGQFGSLKSLVERIPSILKRHDGAFRQ